MLSNRQRWNSKRERLKYHLKSKNINGLPRLIVFRSNKNIFLQLVNDEKNVTILSASSIDKKLQGEISKAKSKVEKSSIVGKAFADMLKVENIEQIIFDRNGYKYHGRVKAVVEAMRKEEIII